MLVRKAEETGRYPKKSDFSDSDVVHIKAYFGPWPHALEAAGLKEPTRESKAERNREKRRRAGERRRNEQKQAKTEDMPDEPKT